MVGDGVVGCVGMKWRKLVVFWWCCCECFE
jgi:hypothetical protein